MEISRLEQCLRELYTEEEEICCLCSGEKEIEERCFLCNDRVEGDEEKENLSNPDNILNNILRQNQNKLETEKERFKKTFLSFFSKINDIDALYSFDPFYYKQKKKARIQKNKERRKQKGKIN